MAVEVLPSQHWATTVGAAWERLLVDRPALRMCLPTGETPLPLFADVVGRRLSWDRASVVLLDEFGDLPPGEAGGCDATLRRELVDRVDLPAGSYRPVDAGAADLAAECAAVDEWLDRGLDLAVLGLGRNGHLGMNEPGSPPESRTRRVELAQPTVDAAERYFGDRARPTWGVTVGLADLLRARQVWVLVTGEAKAETVRAALEDEPDPQLPASLLQSHPSCTWWLDEAAASRLAQTM